MALTWNYGDLLEAVGDRVPDRVALIHGETQRTWGEVAERSNRIARALLDTPGLDPGAHIAFYMTNRVEYLEALTAGFKARLVHLNINYRYVDDELFEVLDNADASIVVYESDFAEHIERLADRLDKVKLFVEVGDSTPRYPGAVGYESLAEVGDGSPLGIGRSGDDLFLLFTGGTTGAPKAVMWRQEDRLAVYKQGDKSESPDAYLDRILEQPGERVLPGPPLMHSTGLTVATRAMVGGGSVVTVGGSFDPRVVWEQIATHEVRSVSIVGDAFARPLLNVLDADLAERLGSLKMIGSAGVMWSEEVKRGLLEYLPELTLVDTFGSSEGSGLGRSVTRAGGAARTAAFRIGDGCKVFTADHDEVEPGSGEQGMIAKSGPIPIGYYKDPERSAATFPVIGGVRYSIPGDWCTVEADGSITLLGRGSNCINTGGEKVFPEEVEEALKALEGVNDALVLGLADPTWGQSVNAVVESDGLLEEQAIRDALRALLAGYKIPKRVVAVESMPRGANGKADYTAARELVVSGSKSVDEGVT
ncbi:MAG: AMP-binding protein [Acidimicrobiales bacterium]